jgi:hypothetical protein
MHIRAKKSFSWVMPDGRSNCVPRGWVGELPDDIAKDAIADGRAVDAGGQAPATSSLDDVVDLDDMTHAQLLALAEERGVEVKNSDSKAKIAAAIKAHVPA